MGRNASALLVGMLIGSAPMENGMEGPQKIKNRAATQFSNSISVYLFQRK